MNRQVASLVNTGRSLAPVVVMLVGWEMVSRRIGERAALFPPPSACLMALIHWARQDDLSKDLLASGKLLFFGLAWGSLAGVMLGLLTGRFRPLEYMLVPIIRLFRPLPPVALLPLFIVLVGIGDRAKIFAISFGVFFPVWLNTYAGAVQTPQRLLWSASTLTRSHWRIFWRIVLPSALPNIVTGVRQGIAIGFVMVFVSELLGTDVGIGYKISIFQLSYKMDAMIAALATLGAAGALTDWLFNLLMLWKFPYLSLLESHGESASRHVSADDIQRATSSKPVHACDNQASASSSLPSARNTMVYGSSEKGAANAGAKAGRNNE